jgi:hemin uptake protein HemP
MQMRGIIKKGGTIAGSPASPEPPASVGDIPVFSSSALLAGRREVIIQHGMERYRLRLTNSNKLILVK